MADQTAPPQTLPKIVATPEATASKVADKQPKKYVFQVLAGNHWEPGLVEDDTGKMVIKDIKYGPGNKAGDIVETDIDLSKRYDKPGMPPKFKRLGEEGVRDDHAAELKAERQRANKATTTLRSAIEKMTRDGLVAWAEEQGIALGNAVKRDDVLRVVLGSLGYNASS